MGVGGVMVGQPWVWVRGLRWGPAVAAGVGVGTWVGGGAVVACARREAVVACARREAEAD